MKVQTPPAKPRAARRAPLQRAASGARAPDAPQLEPTEAKLQAALLKRLHARGWIAVRVNSGARKTEGGGFFRAYFIEGAPDKSAGFPDVMAMRAAPGVTAPGAASGANAGRVELRLFEVKRRGAKQTPPQKRFAAFALSRGLCVEVVEGVEGLDALDL